MTTVPEADSGRREPTMHPAAQLSSPARAAATTTLLLGAGCQAIAFLVLPYQGDTAKWLAWIADHPGRAETAKVLDVLAMPFLIGSVVVYVLLGKERSPRQAWIGGVLFGTGLIGLTLIQGWEVLAYSLVDQEVVNTGKLADVIDGLSSPSAIAVFALFFSGVLVGLLLTAVSLWRSRAVPRGAVGLLLLFLVVDAFLSRPVEGHLIGFAAAAWIALTVARARPIRAPAGT